MAEKMPKRRETNLVTKVKDMENARWLIKIF